jgi:hypothetical protein
VFPKHKEMKPKNYKIMGGFNGKKEKKKKEIKKLRWPPYAAGHVATPSILLVI